MLSKMRPVLLIVFMLFLSGCKVAMLDPKGSIAADEKHIMLTSLALMSIIVIPVIILAFLFAWRYREGNTKAEYLPNWSHSTLLEVIWWSVPCVIIIILGYITWTSTLRLDPYKAINNPAKPIEIQVISLEWKWLFIYPEQHIATINYVEFPVDVPVRFYITAEGPMNSFQIPQLAGQIYAMAGMQTKLNLIANELGIYQGYATNLTGNGFSDMKFTARATSRAEFNQWVKQVKSSPHQLTMNAYNQLAQQKDNHAVSYYSFAASDIYEVAMMKYMMPMPNRGEAILSNRSHDAGKKHV